MKTAIEISHSERQASAQLDSIRELVTRLDHAEDGHDESACEFAAACVRCDRSGFDLADDSCSDCDGKGFTWPAYEHDGLSFEDYHDDDNAHARIYEDPLSVEVRSGWTSPGHDFEPEEFQILLCTGGPAVRIMGELNEYGSPRRAWLEHQDWGTAWQEYHADHDTAALLTYASHLLGG